MELIGTGTKVKSINYVEIFQIKVTKDNYRNIRQKNEEQKQKIIKILKNLKEQGMIKAINKPRNKKIQFELNRLMKAKKDLDKTINLIKGFYSK